MVAETESETLASVADLAAQALEDQQQQQQQQQQQDNYLVDQEEQLLQQQQQQQQLVLQPATNISSISLEPPPPLPPGWIMKESRSQPGVYYYYNQETFETTWQAPYDEVATAAASGMSEDTGQSLEESIAVDQAEAASLATAQQVAEAVAAAVSGTTAAAASSNPPAAAAAASAISHKRSSSDQEANNSSSSNKRSKTPKEVHVLHILKKHKDSRRPSSWRYTADGNSSNPTTITLTREEAREELQGLLEILQDEVANPENLIATFKELASQESDCSSAKRNGDLGFFGRKKMRPEFEAASFALNINELSSIVETASGFHIILRLE